jgi:fructosamine-3-kinase
MQLKSLVENAVKRVLGTSIVTNVQEVTGGDINRAFRVDTDEGRLFVKGNRVSPTFFQLEAQGLNEIRQTNTIAVPNVIEVTATRDGSWSFLLLEWIEGKKTARTEEWLGHRLAQMHRQPMPYHGYHTDTYIGRLLQKNGTYENWVEYYRDVRLASQVQQAKQRGRLTLEREKRIQQLLERIEAWLPSDVQPSLLHGDLWGGNWMVGPNGEPYVIDPSVFYGDAEFELAFTELFGGFSPTFYAAYQEVKPLSPSYEEVKPLYQLYYLLVHLNLFGETYGPAVDRIVKKYIG